MIEVRRIVELARQALEGEAWHGPAVLEILEGMSATVAATKPVPGAHSIWEILRHLSYKQEVYSSILSSHTVDVK